MSKAKDIGTRAETAVRNFLLSAGYDERQARRNVLSGSSDKGDIWLDDPDNGLMVFEIKGGEMAKKASYEQCVKWLDEAQREKKNAGANFGFLVTQRAGVGYPRAGEWFAFARLGDVLTLSTGHLIDDSIVVRVSLRDLVSIIRAEG
jgi:hypothetical protein